MIKTTDYLNPTMFYNDFLDWLVRLESFHSDDLEPPMSADQFYCGSRIQYGCALRIMELLNLRKTDFDLEHRILSIKNPKTKRGGIQKTTILPYDVKSIEKFLSGFNETEALFPVSRQTVWKYYKNASVLGGLKILGAKDVRVTEGAWTHLLRSSCARMYEELGATESLIARKLRHSPRTVTQVYTKIDLNTLLQWEDEYLSVCPAKPDVNDKPYRLLMSDSSNLI